MVQALKIQHRQDPERLSIIEGKSKYLLHHLYKHSQTISTMKQECTSSTNVRI